MIFFGILALSVLSSKQVLLYNEEIVVALSFLGFVVFIRRTFGETIKATFEARSIAILEELQQSLLISEVKISELMDHHESRSNSLQLSTQMITDSCLQEIRTRCVPLCSPTVQTLLHQQIDEKLKKLVGAQQRCRASLLRFWIINCFHEIVCDEFRSSKLSKRQSKLVKQSISLLKRAQL
nr:ATPase subunit 4 [Coleochaete scutata]